MSKIDFANTITELDSGLQKTSDECFKYGITWGCDIDCPVLQRGECELKESDNKDLYQEFLNEQRNHE